MPAVDVFPVPHPQDENEYLLVPNLGHEPVIPDPEFPEAGQVAFQGRGMVAGIVAGSDAFPEVFPQAHLGIAPELGQLPPGRVGELNPPGQGRAPPRLTCRSAPRPAGRAPGPLGRGTRPPGRPGTRQWPRGCRTPWVGRWKRPGRQGAFPFPRAGVWKWAWVLLACDTCIHVRGEGQGAPGQGGKWPCQLHGRTVRLTRAPRVSPRKELPKESTRDGGGCVR